jgi:hypothetical protein
VPNHEDFGAGRHPVVDGSTMNIDAASLSQVAQASVQNQISIKVARKALDAEQEQGDAAISLIKAAAEVAKQTGAGGNLDVQA